MNVFQKVTLASLKKNRVRTAVTIVGIMLSVALTTAVTTSVTTLQQYLIDDEVWRSGSWHLSLTNALPSDVDKLEQDSRITQTVSARTVGYADVDTANEYKPYLYILEAGEGMPEMTGIRLISGALPKDGTELVIPAHLAENGGLYYQVGDTVELTIGDRMDGDRPLGQAFPYYPKDEREPGDSDETFVPRETRTYTVCGIMDRPGIEPYTAAGYTCLTAGGAPDDAALTVWATLKRPSKVYDLIDELHLKESAKPHDHLLYLMGISTNETFLQVVWGMAAILIAMIVFGSVSLIYNAFAISVSERTRQFGLLSSVGATRRQIRYMVGFEAFCVSVIGIPLGILLGLAGIGVTFLAVGERVKALTESGIPRRMHVSWIALAIALAVAVVTVLLSAWIPSRRATRVTAIEAIRQSKDIRAEKRADRTPKWIQRVFGLPGLLGHRWYKRSRKQYRATVLSLFMSVVLFISASAFTSYLQEAVGGVFNEGAWDISYYLDEEDTDLDATGLRDLFESDPNVDRAVITMSMSMRGSMDPAVFSKEATDAVVPRIAEYDKGKEEGHMLYVTFLEDGVFRSLLDENGILPGPFFDTDPPSALVLDEVLTIDEKTSARRLIHLIDADSVTFHAQILRRMDGYTLGGEDEHGYLIWEPDGSTPDAKEIHLSEEASFVQRTLHGDTVLHTRPDYLLDGMTLQFLYPASAMPQVLSAAGVSAMTECHIYAEDHAAAAKSLRKLLEDQHLPSSQLNDLTANRENEQSIITVVKVFSAGFIVLISLIAAANVFNSVSTNIVLRRRSLATLRSVGMSTRQVNGMVRFECLLCGSRALLFGLPASVGATVLIWIALRDGFDSGFHLPIAAMVTAVGSVFAVIFASMIYAMRRLSREDPMEALRSENI